MKAFDSEKFRQQFPALQQSTTFLDSAATALKPACMIEATGHYYQNHSATVHRSQHTTAQAMTARYEQARSLVAELINAPLPEDIVWTKGTTEAINLIAQSYFRPRLNAGDEIIVSEQEHHANLLPWLILAEQTKAKIVKWPIGKQHQPEITTLAELLNEKSRLVAISQMSNVTGATVDLAQVSALAHQYDCRVVVDGAQGIVHSPVDMQQLDIDFYAFSAHKLYGPNGVGVLYAKSELLNAMSPWHGGGKMLTQVSFEGFTPESVPYRFEAGTPNVAGVIGFAATLEWLKTVDIQLAESHAIDLTDYTEQQLSTLPGFISYRATGSTLLAFNIAGIHHHDLATLLAEQNISLRSGQHCAQPLLDALGINGCLRVSFMPYNNYQDADKLVSAVKFALSLLNDE
ncbi:cysteine desulfurase CsdA [Xenorhabdus nematophila]|uniref:cysteine desulfurase CsdA n=1 Tax=Xenorhabdus nematophila TaxID=628 RepID=UPI0003275389|nr:cysteine desulfurase CsdA [Xenorhabdus nematophila]CEF28937.1 cysteine sulfinate desulfinase [Xenorhabdus nematophila str. Websteri]AYA42133.1 cysteine desulfurase CsdA [Xenorhabdus nematophila]MBA0020857.1 cysteine desulfurase CsdA [Xenorhabdus nematophila]MCB4424105.1 cysteine desulfurase CsdA [Xenorhabdus nematophila]QNJ36505.1 cysteine desulfurase CsdA [Xenorhabdus nematophila]